mmetsp:Transcript_4210/g.6318  ORF Transcript_4210/g.6318 Transcript_4210/m.6318 type:complete len:415 (-) Transcript_4210:73-1317(-)
MVTELLLTADEATLGKLDAYTMSHQSLMELVVERSNCKTIFQDSRRQYLDIDSWHGVIIDKNGEITGVDWHHTWSGRFLRLSLEWLPPTVTALNLRACDRSNEQFDPLKLPLGIKRAIFHLNRLRRTVNWKNWPPHLSHLDISHNNLNGTVDLSHLSKNMRDLYLHSNAFDGTLYTSVLPVGMTSLQTHSNSFDGAYVKELPNELTLLTLQRTTNADSQHKASEWLTLHNNKVIIAFLVNCGNILDSAHISQDLEVLLLDRTRTEGSLRLKNLSRSITELTIINNDVSGSVDFLSLPPVIVRCDLHANSLSGTADLTGLPDSLQIFDVHHNFFSGPIDLTRLPQSFQQVILSYNSFQGAVDLRVLPDNIRQVDLRGNNFQEIRRPLVYPNSLESIDFSQCEKATNPKDCDLRKK